MTTQETETVRDEHASFARTSSRSGWPPVSFRPCRPKNGTRSSVAFSISSARTLLPHAEEEEQWLYPVVGKALGNPEATQAR